MGVVRAGHVISKPVVRQCILTAYRQLTDVDGAEADGSAGSSQDENGVELRDRRLPSSAVYEGVLLVFNELNRRSPGAFFDPPSRREVKERVQAFECSQAGTFSQGEFEELIFLFFPDAVGCFTRDIVLACTAIPCLTLATKSAADAVLRQAGSKRTVPAALLACVIGLVWRIVRR
ncbi:hypothetical protein CLOM_g19970 [Closterium sp. NIES-68]|nr:hypothetical protein CLOM_g19970 [Closterium sp. NIES-68]GJP67161.1 hypothetical protein CLOP_g24021 [Closterium sp. NIES-67]